MTERLSALLQAEAEQLDIPTPAAGAVLASGRTIRRRARLRNGVAALAAVAVVGGVATLIPRGDDTTATYSASRYASEGAFAVDRELYVAGVHIPFEEAVKSFYYAADGVVVRSGKSPWTDDADVDHFTLVLPDGSKKQLDLETNDRVVSTEPDSNHLAYAAPNGDGWDVVVVDLLTERELSRTTIEGAFTWGGWEAPPVSVDGAHVWTRLDRGWVEVNWRTHAVRDVPGPDQITEVQNGRYVHLDGLGWQVREMKDGRLVDSGRFPAPEDPSLGDEFGSAVSPYLSPDGRYLMARGSLMLPDGIADPPPYVVDLATGEQSDLADIPHTFGWTPDGRILFTERGVVSTCDPVPLKCAETGLVVKEKPKVLKMGGNSYES